MKQPRAEHSTLFSFQHPSRCVGRFRVWPHERRSKMIALRVGLLRHALRLRGASFPRARPTFPNLAAYPDRAAPCGNPLGLKPQPLKFDTCHLLRALACDSASAKVQQWTRSGSGFCASCLFLYNTRKSTNTDNLVKFQYVEQQIQSLRTPGIRCTLGTA